MLICKDCGCRFDTPRIVDYSENLDGEQGVWHYHSEECPECGSQDFEEVEEVDA